MIIIAECGNNHEGSINLAMELLEKAKESGADLVKFQAGIAKDFVRTNNIKEIEFYKKFELGIENYKKLIQRGKELNIPVFFSIWGQELEELRYIEKYHKIPARQCNIEQIQKYDSPYTFISMPYNIDIIPLKEKIFLSSILHVVNEYPCYNPRLERIIILKSFFQRTVGYSDHTIGISTCCIAAKNFGAEVIEKHFTLHHNFSNFRDHLHSATPNEFKRMVEILKGE